MNFDCSVAQQGCPRRVSQSIVAIPWISSWFEINFCDTSNKCFIFFLSCFWWNANFLGNPCQNERLRPLSRTGTFPTSSSSRWGRVFRLPADDQFSVASSSILSLGARLLRRISRNCLANLCQWLSESSYGSRSYCTWARIYIWLPRLRTRCCVFVWIFSCAHAVRLKLWLGAVSIPGLVDALELSAVEDFLQSLTPGSSSAFESAVTPSSPVLSRNLFNLVVAQLSGLNLLMLKTRKRLFHSSRLKLPVVSMAASWCLVSMYLIWIFVSRPSDHEYPSGGFHSIVTCVNPVQASNRSRSSSMFQSSSIRLSCSSSKVVCVALAHIHISLWNWEWFFFRDAEFDSWFNVMTVNVVSLQSTRGRSWLHCHPEWRLMVETRRILHEDLLELRLVQGVPVPKWMFSEPDHSQNILNFPSATGNLKLSPLFGVITSFGWSFRLRTSGTPMFPDSPEYTAYPRNIRGKTFFQNWYRSLVAALQMFNKSPLIMCFSVR